MKKFINESDEKENEVKLTSEQKKQFLEAVYNFSKHSKNIYRPGQLSDTVKYLGSLIEAASKLTLAETEDWFDNVTVSRHMKQVSESYKIFEKTAKEMISLQQRLESCYEDIGTTLNKYYEIGDLVNEAQEMGNSNKDDFHKFFTKAMKKMKINSPADLETPTAKKKFFKWIDKHYVSKSEKQNAVNDTDKPIKEYVKSVSKLIKN